jgi:alanine racemase
MPRPIRAAISAGAISHNLSVARRHAGSAKVWAVIKANAYGHGLERAARAARAADGFAVLDFEEAACLRRAGLAQPILLLEGMFERDDVALVAQHRLTPVIHRREQIEMLAAAAAPVDVYLKVNSGMNRLGFAGNDVAGAYQALAAHPRVKSITLMTHFADADGATGIDAQLERFARLTKSFRGARSLANSAALLRSPQARGDWVRPGIMLYGCSPFADQSAQALGLRPAMTLTSEIIAVQQLAAGDGVGYGFAFRAERPMRIGVVACGYADGYPRHAPAGTPILVNGQRTRTVGRVSMDMITLDLSELPQASLGSAVTLWGEGLSADEVGAAAGTLSYELLCALAPRVPVVEVA